MRKSLRGIALLMGCALLLTLLPTGCGSSKGGDDITVNTQGSSASNEATVNNDTQKEPTSIASKTGAKKKIVIIQESNDSTREDIHKRIIAELVKNGFSSNNSEITLLKMDNDEKKSQAIISKTEEIKPDIVIINQTYSAVEKIGKPLSDTGIPVVLTYGVENPALGLLDANDFPKQNVTGVYTSKKDLYSNSYKFLQKISPTNGKKAVFVTISGFFDKAFIEKSIKEAGVDLKEYCETNNVEDFESTIQKYNKDPEVAWVLIGVWPTSKKDGTTVTTDYIGKWYAENAKKPSVTFWEIAVQMGVLCALGNDMSDMGTQATDMAVRILKGESVKNVKAEEPRKTNIVLNQKSATQLGITFPLDILGSSKVYIDYNGHTTADIKK